MQPTIFALNGSSPVMGISGVAGGWAGSISGSPVSGSVTVAGGMGGGLGMFGGLTGTKMSLLICR